MAEQNETGSLSEAKRVIEGLLFCSSEPIPLSQFCSVLQPSLCLDKQEVKTLLDELASEYRQQNRAFFLDEIAKGYLLRTHKELSPYIHALLKKSRPEKLSQASAEVLAIIAFRQPITRPQIDEIRGVDSASIITSLCERQLVDAVGKLEAPGRPTLYGVTTRFLQHFGLNDPKELKA